MLDIHFAPDLYLLTIVCFYKLYWNTVICVQAKKCGFRGWNANAYIIPLVVLKGFYDVALEIE